MLTPHARTSWLRRASARISRILSWRRQPAGRLEAPVLVIDHPHADAIRAWAGHHLPCSFTASDGMVHTVTLVTVTEGLTGVRVRLDFARSMWTNAEDETLARQLAQRAAIGIACWIGAGS